MRPLAYLTARLGLGALFLVAGALKLRDPYAFALEIANYQLFPALAPWLAAALPATEIVVGVALVAGPRPWARAGALVAALLLGAFTVAATSAVVRGVNISCGCFGADSGPVTWLTVARDVGLVALALWVYARPEPMPRWPFRRPGAAPAARLERTLDSAPRARARRGDVERRRGAGPHARTRP